MLNKINLFDINNKKEVVIEKERSSNAIKSLIVLVTIIICSSFYILRINNDSSSGSFEIPSEGFVWTGEDLIADYSFPIKRSPDEYQNDLNEISLNSYLIFDKINNVYKQESDKLNNISNKYIFENNIKEVDPISKVEKNK